MARWSRKDNICKSHLRRTGRRRCHHISYLRLVNEYTAGDGSPVYHFDFYRIKKLDEVYDMGYEDYFYSGNLCFLEWPELIEDLLPEDCTKVTITVEEDGTRSVEW